MYVSGEGNYRLNILVDKNVDSKRSSCTTNLGMIHGHVII